MSTNTSFIPVLLRKLLISMAVFGIAIACRKDPAESERSNSVRANKQQDVGNELERERRDDEFEERERDRDRDDEDEEYEDNSRESRYKNRRAGKDDSDVISVSPDEPKPAIPVHTKDESFKTEGSHDPVIPTPQQPKSEKDEEEVVSEDEKATLKDGEADSNEKDESAPCDKNFEFGASKCSRLNFFKSKCDRWIKICDFPKDYEFSFIESPTIECCSDMIMRNRELNEKSPRGPEEAEILAKYIGVAGNTTGECEVQRIGVERHRVGFKICRWMRCWGARCRARKTCCGQTEMPVESCDQYAIVTFNRGKKIRNLSKSIAVRWKGRTTQLDGLKDMDADNCKGNAVDLRLVAYITYTYKKSEDEKNNCNNYEYFISKSSRDLLCKLLPCSKKLRYTFQDPKCCKDVSFTIHKAVLKKFWFCGMYYMKNCGWFKRLRRRFGKKDHLVFLGKNNETKCFNTCYEPGCEPCNKPCDPCNPCDPCPKPCDPCPKPSPSGSETTSDGECCDPCPKLCPPEPCEPCGFTFKDICKLRWKAKNGLTRLKGIYNRRGPSYARKIKMVVKNCSTGECNEVCLAVVHQVYELSGRDCNGNMIKTRIVASNKTPLG